ncbi:MAG: nitroreductase family protein [Opitutales bacterium]
MEAIENILSRNSVRRYLEKEVSQADIETILKCAMAAPTGKNVRDWEFVVVKNKETLSSIAEALPFAKMLPACSVAITVCADETKSDYWFVNASAAAQNILLACNALGLGAVWATAYPYEERMDFVSKALNLPENIKPLCIIPIGYPATEPKLKDKFIPAKIHLETFKA